MIPFFSVFFSSAFLKWASCFEGILKKEKLELPAEEAIS